MLSCTRAFVKNRFARNFSFCHKTTEKVIVSNVNVEPDPQIFYKFLTNKFKKNGSKTALVDAELGTKVSYNELVNRSSIVASFLHDKGLASNDCVGIHVPNCLEYAYTIFGAMEKGITLTTANPAYTQYELKTQWESSNPRVLFTNRNLVDVARKSVENTNVDVLVSLDDSTVNDSGVVNLSEIMEKYKPLQTDYNVSKDDDVAYLLYSSGTTGVPKGVMLTQANIKTMILQLLEHFNWFLEERHLCFLPFYHAFALILCLLKPLYYGSTVHVLNGFQPEVFLKAIEKYKLQRCCIVPPIALFLKDHPLVNKYDLSSMKSMLVGAAPIDDLVLKTIDERFPDLHLFQGYGLTELSPVCTMQPTATAKEYCKPGSAGVVIPNTEIRIVDVETGENCDASQTGEVWVRGPQVMKGYLNNKEATDGFITPEGWAKTGDLGYYDDDLNLFIVDRLKELIKYKGLQVAPAELEGVLIGHPSIVDSCVIGCPDERSGELPRAYVVTSDERLTEQDVHVYVNERVADHKKLRGGIEFVKEIPKSPTGKILRRVLRDELAKNI